MDNLLNLLWLLLPVAAASGWWAAMRAQARGASVFYARGTPRSASLTPHYFKGINYLLDQQPDKAIEVFLKMLEVESETVETHFALGNLFRRRGEVDRAIRIHQNLMASQRLTTEERQLATLEMGMDYMRAGLLDRAEGLFKELLDSGVHMRQSLTQLLDIYQQEQDWDQAIIYARRLESVSGQSLSGSIAHFYCEQAEEAKRDQDFNKLQTLLEQALLVDHRCVRATLMAAGAAMQQQDWNKAVSRLRRVEAQDAAFVSESLEPLRECYRQLGETAEFEHYLKRMADKHDAIAPVLALAELTAQQAGNDAALAYLIARLKRRPNVRGWQRLLAYTLAQAQGQTRDHLQALLDSTSLLLEDQNHYRCLQCGFSGHTLHWHCPSCKSWNTVKPLNGNESG